MQGSLSVIDLKNGCMTPQIQILNFRHSLFISGPNMYINELFEAQNYCLASYATRQGFKAIGHISKPTYKVFEKYLK